MLLSMPASPALVVMLPQKIARNRHRRKEDDIVLRRPLPQRTPRRSKLLEPAPPHQTYRNYKKSKSK